MNRRQAAYLYFRFLEFCRPQPILSTSPRFASWCEDQAILSALAERATGIITPITVRGTCFPVEPRAAA